MIVSTDEDRIGTIAYSRLLVAGLFSQLVSIPLVVFMIRAMPAEQSTRWVIVPLPSVSRTIDFFPSFAAGAFDVSAWLWGLLADLFWVVFGVLYYLVLAAATGGAILVVAGAVGIADPRAIVRAIERTLELRIVRVLLGFYAVAGVVIFFPAAFLAGLEVFVALGLWLGFTAGLGVTWQRIDTRGNHGTRVAVGYPLLFALAVVPMVVASLASPTLRPLFVSITAKLVGPVFGGLGAGIGWVDGVLSLAPTVLGFMVFWVVAAIVMGWTVGILTEGIVWFVPLIVDRVVTIGRRGVRYARRIRDGVR